MIFEDFIHVWAGYGLKVYANHTKPCLRLLYIIGQGDIPNTWAPRGRQSAGLNHFGVILYMLYIGTVGGLGKEPISSKSNLGNHCLNLVLHIPGQVQYKFQAPFKMIFLEKKALDCEILIGNRQRASNKNHSWNMPSLMYANNFLSY